MTTGTPKKQIGAFDTPEAIRESGGVINATKSAIRDEWNQGVSIAWDQLLGTERAGLPQNTAGDLKEGEEIVFSSAESAVGIEPGYDYKDEILHIEERSMREEEGQTRARIQQITIELEQVKQSTPEAVSVEANINQPIQNAGIYHESFLESVLKRARTKVQESAEGLMTVASKAARRDYWSLAKSHGTSFTLNSERVVATQTG